MPAVSLTDLGSTAIIQGAPSLPQITVSGFFTLTNAIGGPQGRRRLLLGARRLQLDHGRARPQAGRRALVQQDHPGHAAQQLRRLHVQQQRHQERAGGLPDRHSERDDAGRAGHRPVEQLVRRGLPAGRLPHQRADDAESRPAVGRPDARHRSAEPVQHLRARPEVHRQTRRRRSGSCSTAIPASSAASSRRRGTICRRASGFVWDPFGDGKTAIRAAGGIFYGSISGNEWNTMTNFQPWSTRLTFTNINATTNAAGVPQRRVAQQSLQQLTSAARRSPTTVRTPTAAASSACRRTSSGRAPTRPTSACSARSASRWPSARPTSGRSTATCRSGAT